jgi:hypothetical protein
MDNRIRHQPGQIPDDLKRIGVAGASGVSFSQRQVRIMHRWICINRTLQPRNGSAV